MTRPVEMPFEYTVEPTDQGVRLIVSREVINFVREVIPDGRMAGMMGHRPVPSTQEFSFDLHVSEARHLLDQLQRVLGSRSWHS